MANGLAGGSGWVIRAYNLHTGEVHNYWAWDHMHNVPMGRPLLVLDMYEHSYHLDYGAAPRSTSRRSWRTLIGTRSTAASRARSARVLVG